MGVLGGRQGDCGGEEEAGRTVPRRPVPRLPLYRGRRPGQGAGGGLGTLEACPPSGIAQRGMQKLAPPEEGQEAAEVHVEAKPPAADGAAAKEAKEEL